MLRRFGLVLLLAASGILLALAGSPALAAAKVNGPGNGLKVSPVATNITIQPGKTQVVVVYLQNLTSQPATFQALINDFQASGDETGTPALLLNNQFAPSHSLKRYVAPINPVTLAAGERKSVNVVVTIPKDAPGGGYYGAVRFAPVTSSSGTNNVTLSASVGSLILVKVPGDIHENMRLLSLDVRQGAGGTPSAFFTSGSGLVAMARFQNNGDVQEQPFGKILLEQGSKILGSYEINNTVPRGNVLPDSTRRFTVSLDKVGAFGKYTVVGNFGYGSGQLLSGKTTFYVVPIPAIITIVVIVLIVIALIIAVPKMIRRYNKRILKQAGRK